jgi:hypothetical protein
MLKLLISCFFVFLCCGCVPNGAIEDKLDYQYKTGTLEIVSNIILGENDLFNPSSAHLTFKKCGSFYGFLSQGGDIRFYDDKGKRRFLFKKNSLDHHYEFPSGLPRAFDLDPDLMILSLLFAESDEIIEVDTTGNILNRILLKIPEEFAAMSFPQLSRDNSRGIIHVTLGHKDSDLDQNAFFKSSPIISQFTNGGDYVRSMGQYPIEYSNSGKFKSGNAFTYFRHVYIDGGHFFAYDITGDIEHYNNDGTQFESIKLRASQRNYRFDPSKISHFSSELPEFATNDINYFLSKNKSQDIFYMGIQKLRKEHGNKDTFLVRFNRDSSIISEVNLTETFGVAYHAMLPAIIENDTLDFFLASPFAEEVRVVRAILKTEIND